MDCTRYLSHGRFKPTRLIISSTSIIDSNMQPHHHQMTYMQANKHITPTNPCLCIAQMLYYFLLISPSFHIISQHGTGISHNLNISFTRLLLYSMSRWRCYIDTWKQILRFRETNVPDADSSSMILDVAVSVLSFALCIAVLYRQGVAHSSFTTPCSQENYITKYDRRWRNL